MYKPAFAVAVFVAVAASYSIVPSVANANELLSGLQAKAVSSDLRLAMMDEKMMMMMMDKMGPGKMGDKMPADSSMPSTDSSGSMQDPMATPSPMDMMGRMRGPMKGRPAMSSMAPASRLPGFPGASHLYHVGATGFFLDHPQHITLSIEQQTALNRIKEKSLLDRASSDRRIEEAEQELWLLTASDSPDAAKIETQVRAIEKHRGDQRLAFIRDVGEAGKILTADQRPALLGTKPSPGNKPPAAVNKPAPMPRM